MADFRTVFDPAAVARERVTRHCAHRVTSTILAQAIARAERSVRNGLNPSEATARATSWAISANHEPPEAA